MKTIKFTMAIIVGILFVSLQSCTHDDYIPVPGPVGENGTDGVAGTASCEACHSASHRDPIIASYEASSHKMGGHTYGTNTTFSDGSLNSNRAFCSQCHSQEGFIDNLKYGKPNPRGYDVYQAISCEGCHGQLHRSLNFAADGNDFGLRNITAVVQKYNTAFTLNASATDGKSSANTCISCHQARPDSNGFYKRPVIESGEKDINGAVVINNASTGPTFKYWSKKVPALAVSPYPAAAAGTNYKTYSNISPSGHASPQADIWMGVNGVDIDGTTTHLPNSKTAVSHYSKGVSCVTCHMDKPKAVGTGLHSLGVSFESCVSCHGTGGAETKLAALNTEYDASIEKLRLALSAKTSYFTTSSTGSISVNTGFGTANDTYYSKDVPLKYAQAFFNYKLLTGVKTGQAVHNPSYVRALIQNSIEALQ